MFKEAYENLVKAGPNSATYLEAKRLAEAAEAEAPYYYHLFRLFIIDYYLAIDDLEGAKLIAEADLKTLDQSAEAGLYFAYLERLVYLYLAKENYSVAYKYASKKRELIAESDNDAINRSNLEFAHIYVELGQKIKAIAYLQLVLDNAPDPESFLQAQSDLAKLYLDDGLLPEAEEALNNALKVAADSQSESYCMYLYAKLSAAKGDQKGATKAWIKLLKNGLDAKNASYALDYLDFLLAQNELAAASALVEELTQTVYRLNLVSLKRFLAEYRLKLLALQQRDDQLLLAVSQLINRYKEQETLNSKAYLAALEEGIGSGGLIAAKDNAQLLITFSEGLSRWLATSSSIRELLASGQEFINPFVPVDKLQLALFKARGERLQSALNTWSAKGGRVYEKEITFNDLKKSFAGELLASSKPALSQTVYPNTLDFFTQAPYEVRLNSYLYGQKAAGDAGFLIMLVKGASLDSAFHESLLAIFATTLLLAVDKLLARQETASTNEILGALSEEKLWYLAEGAYLTVSARAQRELKLPPALQLADYRALIARSDQWLHSDFAERTAPVSYRLKVGRSGHILVKETAVPLTTGGVKYLVSLTVADSPELVKIAELLKDAEAALKDPEYKFTYLQARGAESDRAWLEAEFGVKSQAVSSGEFVALIPTTDKRFLDRIATRASFKLALISVPKNLTSVEQLEPVARFILASGGGYFTKELYERFLAASQTASLVESALISPQLRLKPVSRELSRFILPAAAAFILSDLPETTRRRVTEAKIAAAQTAKEEIVVLLDSRDLALARPAENIKYLLTGPVNNEYLAAADEAGLKVYLPPESLLRIPAAQILHRSLAGVITGGLEQAGARQAERLMRLFNLEYIILDEEIK